MTCDRPVDKWSKGTGLSRAHGCVWNSLDTGIQKYMFGLFIGMLFFQATHDDVVSAVSYMDREIVFFFTLVLILSRAGDSAALKRREVLGGRDLVLADTHCLRLSWASFLSLRLTVSFPCIHSMPGRWVSGSSLLWDVLVHTHTTRSTRTPVRFAIYYNEYQICYSDKNNRMTRSLSLRLMKL